MNRGHYLDRDPLDKWFRKYHFPITQPPAAAGGSVATDVIFDAKGDLAVGTGADTAAKLTVGANSFHLVADSTQTTGLKWVPDDLVAEKYRGSNSVLRETIAREFVRDNTLAIGATGVMFSQSVMLYQGDVITSIAMRSGSVAAGTPLNWWFALYDTAGTPALVFQTADQTTTAWAANTTKDLALTGGPYTVTTTGLHWFSVMMKATTVVNMNGQGAASATIHAGLVAGMIVKSQTSGTTLTTTAPGTITGGTGNANSIYAIGH